MATKTVNSFSSQSRNPRNTVGLPASASVGKKKRETWTDGETDSLLSHAIIHKGAIDSEAADELLNGEEVEKSKDGDGPGFSDEEEVHLTINNALANTTPEESFDLRARNNTLKRPSSSISVYSSGRTTRAADSSLHSNF
ncbi:hypothetical protein GHT06_014477 [Daphnia sinensis]|uniref:Uncharacterized protein n=1 Tax=Daphnia sinensis TaxID=1820382 RepID=A0AAD5KTU7_9CRUS|nr:hypothetical protein GHT06_014477 [Daphnia sinensis]